MLRFKVLSSGGKQSKEIRVILTFVNHDLKRVHRESLLATLVQVCESRKSPLSRAEPRREGRMRRALSRGLDLVLGSRSKKSDRGLPRQERLRGDLDSGGELSAILREAAGT